MKNHDAWQPTKFVFNNGSLVSSKDEANVGVGSRLITNITAQKYDTLLPLHARGDLLDLGCGYAPLYLKYRDTVSSCICADWVNSLHQNPHLDVSCDLSKPLPFSDDSFDTILLSDVLEHIPTPQALLGEIERVLRPGGKIILNVPFYYWLHEQPFDYYRYTRFALEKFVSDANLKLLELSVSAGPLEILADIVGKLSVRVPLVGKIISSSLQKISLSFWKTKKGQKLTASLGESFPLSYFVVAEKKTSFDTL